MPGASDYMVGNAPAAASYAAPLLNFAPVANYPQDYFQGQQRQRELALQQPFVDPPTGQPMTDPIAINKELMRRGGAPYAQNYADKLLPMIASAIANKPISDVLSGNTAPSPGPAANNPNAAGPANLRNSPQTPQAQPQLSSAGADNNGAPTVRSIAAELFGGRDVSPMIPRFAAAVGVDPDAPLNPQQAMRVQAIMRPRAPQPNNAVAQGPHAVNSTEESINGPNARPTQVAGSGALFAPSAGVSGSPGPSRTPANPAAQSPPQMVPQPQAQGAVPSAAQASPERRPFARDWCHHHGLKRAAPYPDIAIFLPALPRGQWFQIAPRPRHWNA
jgi:hypothetical protein